MQLNLTEKEIIVVTHKSILPCIPGDDLKKFLLKNNCRTLLYITHPLLIMKESYQLLSEGGYYTNSSSQPTKIFTAFHWVLPESFAYVKDFIYTVLWTLKTKQTYNLYFGINNINTLAGIILRKFGRVKKVIYYTIDLYPQRFKNQFINWVYHKLDKLCVRLSDETWNVSQAIAETRLEHGLETVYNTKQFTVPIGIWFDEISRVPLNKVKENKIVYRGHLMPFRGLDLAIKALPKIIKMIPHAELTIVGGGEQLDCLKHLATKLEVNNHIKFHGFIKNPDKATLLISDGAIGLAPYNTEGGIIKNADPAKIKDYLALGIPVITTHALSNSLEIKKARCGLIVNHTPQSLANAIIKLLSDKKLLEEYRKNALEYVKQFDWNSIFTKNISRLLS